MVAFLIVNLPPRMTPPCMNRFMAWGLVWTSARSKAGGVEGAWPKTAAEKIATTLACANRIPHCIPACSDVCELNMFQIRRAIVDAPQRPEYNGVTMPVRSVSPAAILMLGESM